MDAARGPSFAADQDEGPQQGSGRPIPPLVSKIQVATTNAGARAQGGLTPDFLALSLYDRMAQRPAVLVNLIFVFLGVLDVESGLKPSKRGLTSDCFFNFL